MPPTPVTPRGVVCLLARAPSAPGKTRLTAGLSPERALALRRALFLDTFEAVVASRLPAIVCYTPTTAREELEALMRAASDASSISLYGGPRLPCPERSRREPRPNLIAQASGDLGARMHAAFVDVFARGVDRVVLIGSDLPTLPPEHLVAAMAALDRAPLVIGPADDGGYYLIGLREPHPELFEGVTWGSEDVLAQTMAITRRVGLSVEMTSAWHDVDAPEDLQRVVGTRARHTRAWLESR